MRGAMAVACSPATDVVHWTKLRTERDSETVSMRRKPAGGKPSGFRLLS
jgi:hypothetical protein